MGTFQDCIVSFLDLNDVTELLTDQSSLGVKLMRDFHRLVASRVHKLKAHEEICFWQDSVLLLAFVDATEPSYQQVMNDVVKLKEAIDRLHPSHAVCIKGQSFPSPRRPSISRKRPRSIYLSASSLAFSNCFKVEAGLKKHKADWYLDSRIVKRIKGRDADAIEVLTLHPRSIRRKIHMFRGSFDVTHSPERSHEP